jgi:hypothetical protein
MKLQAALEYWCGLQAEDKGLLHHDTSRKEGTIHHWFTFPSLIGYKLKLRREDGEREEGLQFT